MAEQLEKCNNRLDALIEEKKSLVAERDGLVLENEKLTKRIDNLADETVLAATNGIAKLEPQALSPIRETLKILDSRVRAHCPAASFVKAFVRAGFGDVPARKRTVGTYRYQR